MARSQLAKALLDHLHAVRNAADAHHSAGHAADLGHQLDDFADDAAVFRPLVGFKANLPLDLRVNPVPCLHVYTVFHPVISIRFVDLNV